MSSAHLLRLQIEAALAGRIPSALTPAPRVIRSTAPTGIAAVDDLLGGGLPLGAISELSGPECSGRTSVALSFVAGLTRAGRVCAWIDASDALDPESAAGLGVDLDRLLWVRCGVEPQQLPLPGFAQETGQIPAEPAKSARGAGPQPHPQPHEETQRPFAPRCAEPQPRVREQRREVIAVEVPLPRPGRPIRARKPWQRLDQALRAADLLLQGGGFSAVVLDMGSIAPKYALRVPLATWFRYRAAAERSQASVVLLTQQACTKSSAGLLLHCEAGKIAGDQATVFGGVEPTVRIVHERFAREKKSTHKPPGSASGTGG